MSRQLTFRRPRLQRPMSSTLAANPRRRGGLSENTGTLLDGCSVLVVDDDEGTRELETLMLQSLGFRVDAVASGEEAVKYLEDCEVDLLVLDMTMPGIDGTETYRRVLQLQPRQRAIIVSGTGMYDRVAEAMEMGVSAYVCKPAGPDALARAATYALASNRERRQGITRAVVRDAVPRAAT